MERRAVAGARGAVRWSPPVGGHGLFGVGAARRRASTTSTTGHKRAKMRACLLHRQGCAPRRLSGGGTHPARQRRTEARPSCARTTWIGIAAPIDVDASGARSLCPRRWLQPSLICPRPRRGSGESAIPSAGVDPDGEGAPVPPRAQWVSVSSPLAGLPATMIGRGSSSPSICQPPRMAREEAMTAPALVPP